MLPSPSTPQLAAQYDRDGYVIVPALLSETRVGEIERALARYLREVAPGLSLGDIVYEADGQSVRNLWRLEEHDLFFRALQNDPAIVALAGALLPAPPVCIAVETFNKPSRVGSAVPYHQDNAYFNFVPADALTVWIALDDSTPENGCMVVAEGSHRSGIVPHGPSGVAGNSQGARHLPDTVTEAERAIRLRRGDACVHHCLTLHRSEPNRSDASRRGLLLVYRSEQAVRDVEAFTQYLAQMPEASGPSPATV